jgi:hypothetical protein
MTLCCWCCWRLLAVVVAAAATTTTSTTSSHLNAAAGAVLLCRTLSRTCHNSSVQKTQERIQARFRVWRMERARGKLSSNYNDSNNDSRSEPEEESLTERCFARRMHSYPCDAISPINPRRASHSFFRQQRANE